MSRKVWLCGMLVALNLFLVTNAAAQQAQVGVTGPGGTSATVTVGQQTDGGTTPTTRNAHANLVPPDGSVGITATLIFVDDGQSLEVTGTSTGMDPNKHYHTLIYDRNSQWTGPTACIPSAVPPAGGLSFDQMQIGSWQPLGATARSLNARRTGPAYVPLFAIGTASVRRHDQTGPQAVLPLLSCGQVQPD
jgi:hypothetical protein